MTAPLFLVGPGALTADSGTVLLDGPEGRHAADVQRISPGQEVLLADGEGRWALGVVAAAQRGALRVTVLQRGHDPVPALRTVLVQALAKGDRDLMAVEAATELDVDEVVPWQADRSIVRWKGERGQRAHRKWEQTVRTATKQSRRTRVPQVGAPVDRAALLARVAAARLALVLHERADQPLAGTTLPDAGDLLLVVGPEGGISDAELAALVAAGARPVRLGSTVLRTSTAGPAALAVLAAAGRWR